MIRSLFLFLLLCSCALPGLAQQACHICKSTVGVQDFEYRTGSLPVCSKCASSKPRCDLCQAPSGTRTHRDGRDICAVCLKTGVFSPSRVQLIAKEANAYLARILGPKFTKSLPPIQLVDQDEMQTKFNEGGRVVDAIAFYQAYNPELVYVLTGVTEMEISHHLVHELTHAWQSRACPSQDRALVEGFATWMEYQFLLSKGEQAEARRLTRHQDPDYGASLVHLLARSQALGQAKFLEQIQKARKLSDV